MYLLHFELNNIVKVISIRLAGCILLNLIVLLSDKDFVLDQTLARLLYALFSTRPQP